MQDIAILDSIERYIRGEMLPEERVFFEHLRKSNPGVDQMVVEHTIFLNQMNKYGERKDFKSQLNEIHKELFEAGKIKTKPATRMVYLWKKYKRVLAVAASIAGITALGITMLISYLSPKASDAKVEFLSKQIHNKDRQINNLEIKVIDITKKLNEVPRTPAEAPKVGGTGFLVDANGYLVTNAHIVNHATTVSVQNNKGQEFKTKIIYIEPTSDLAFLKIDDEDFKSYGSLPYSINKNSADLGEQIFTLGYPRDEIVYGEGYMSAKTGFEGDTLACQIAVAANPGNSGGPVLNRNGEVIGVLSTRQIQAQGVVFAIRSKNIFKMLDEIRMIKGDSSIASLKIPTSSAIKGLDRVQQIKKIEDCIFIVKSY